MLKINKITSNTVVDFAAEELKKYLRMMMTEGGDIKIAYDPAASDGFRLGLMQDFGLDVSDVKDPALDDILYIDTDTEGGIIAGDNPRSVLLAVYEYLKKNGCRWLFPGVDGELIPTKDIEPVSLRFVPTFRHRSQCIEGANYQASLVENIDYSAKIGLNSYMLEFRIPPHYNNYYNRKHNTVLPPEPISTATILQWKRACEAELAKRGMEYHDVGHGWTGDSFLDSASTIVGWGTIDPESVTEETKKYLALVNGERKFFNDAPGATNFCMSNPEARKIVIAYILKYIRSHSNADFVHVWLADQVNNHCECEECRKKTPSDWMVVLMNELDEALTAEGLTNRIGFVAYVDTFHAPKTEVIKNPDRFILNVGPITRKYVDAIDEERIGEIETPPYVLNKSELPTSIEEYLAYVRKWQINWHGSNMAFEYHFWRYSIHSVSGLSIARSAFEDAKVYGRQGFNGLMQNGSQRIFFPTGFAFYAYAAAIYDESLTYEEVAEDYFSSLFGEDWRKFYAFLERAEWLLPFRYLALADGRKSFVDPEMAEHIEKNLDSVLSEGRELVRTHYNSELRVRTYAVRILEYFLRYLELFAGLMLEKARGDEEAAMARFREFRDEFSRHEIFIERVYDHYQMFSEITRMAERTADSKMSVFYI